MNSRLLAAALLALGCLGAAATGAYLALRHNESDRAAAVATPVTSTPSMAGEGQAPVGESAAAARFETSGQLDARSANTDAGVAREPGRSASPARTRAENPTTRGAPDARPAAPVAGATPSTAASAVTEAQASSPSWPIAPAPEAVTAQAPPVPPAPDPQPTTPQLEEIVVPAEAVIGLQIERAISSETARVEDRVLATVTRDVRVGQDVAIPSGARLEGSVVMVERGGKFQERARLGVRFHTVVFRDGSTLPIQTETIYREGSSPAGESAAKVGAGAIGGAVLGAILGGGKGAAIGGAAGAGAGTAAVMAGGRNPATIPAGANVTVRLARPVTVLVER